jgi:DNA invertase Pin-like site-specific DNA recombinase/phosphoglycolate phosphatase-like HAD superfamily hydrolase
MARTSRKNTAAQTAVPEVKAQVWNTALYVRLSVLDSGKKDGESIVNQQDMLERYIAERPEFALKAVYVDNGETGVDFLRPAWNDLIADCKAGKINAIILKDLSRLGRNYIETGEYLEKIFPLLGVRLIAVNDQYDNLHLTNNERLISGLKNLVNDIYAKDISRKSAAALAIKQKNGEFIGDYAAYGYLKDPDDKHRLIVDPETAPIVRQVFAWKAEGMGTSQIVRRLNDAGILAPHRYRLEKGIIKSEKYRDSLWQVKPITDLLHNPVYLGHIAQRKNVGALHEGKGRSRAKADDWVIVENMHEPIVTQEVFDLVKTVMANRTAEYKSADGKFAHFTAPEQLLAGLVFCADCGKSLLRYKQVTKSGSKCDWIYLCRSYEMIKECTKKSIHQEDLERAVYDAIRLEIEKCADIGSIIDKLNRESGHKARLARYEKEIEDCEREIKRIATLKQGVYEDYAAKLLTASEYRFVTEKYNSDTVKLQARLDAANESKARFTQSATPANKWLAAFRRFMDAKELTAQMAKALIERVEVSDYNKVHIIFKFRDEYTAIAEVAAAA